MGVLLRRSGIGAVQITSSIPWRADAVYQVGVGNYHQELDVMAESWPGVKFFGCDPRPCEGYPGQFFQVAITDRVSNAMLNMKSRHPDGSSLLPLPGQPNAKQIMVATTTLDAMFPTVEPGRIMLWLDCEGSETKTLLGGPNFLRHVHVVNVEHSAGTQIANGRRQSSEVYKLLVASGFWLLDNHTLRLQQGQCDYVYCRKELFRPELCLSPQEIIRWETAYP